jgi:uncharacterized membrane protein YedE/YeeE
MNTLRNNQKTVLTLTGFGIGMVLLGSYLRSWWNMGGAGQEIQISTVAFMVLAYLVIGEVKSLIEDYQTRPRK